MQISIGISVKGTKTSGPPSAPVNTVAPVISGNESVGSTLTLTSVGSYTGAVPITYTYQWYRGGSTVIVGQTSTTYITQVADVGLQVTCQVNASNAYGGTFVPSNYIIPTLAAPVNTVEPVVSFNNLYVGGTLTTTNGTWSGSPTSFTYQWYNVSVGDPIAGATNNTYTLLTSNAGTEINCKVTGTNATGSGDGYSNVINTLALAAPTNIDLPFIDDGTTYYEGSTLGFTGNVWDSNPPNPTLTYQWLRNGGQISGATDDTYDAISADVTNMIAVKCIATNSQGTDFVISNEVLIEP